MGTGTGLLPSYMKDPAGRFKPAYMVDWEIRAELGGDTNRRAALVLEMRERHEARRNARANAVKQRRMYLSPAPRPL